MQNNKPIGLPEHNVLLEGDLHSPVLVNNTRRGIIAYTVHWVNNPGPSIWDVSVSFPEMREGQASVIPAGSRRTLQRDTRVAGPDGRSPGPPLAVNLDAVVFADGEVVGPDKANTFDMLSTRIKAEQDIHQKLLNAAAAGNTATAWGEIAIAAQKRGRAAFDGQTDPRYSRMQQTWAAELIRVRDRMGEAAAIELAGKSAKYPKLWRKHTTGCLYELYRR